MNDQIPNIGFGTWKLKNEPQSSEIIRQAMAAGYRLFDTASAYENEEVIGAGLQGFDREALCISGTLWNADRGHVLDACQRSLERLRVDYLDLYLVHWPASAAVHPDWQEINRSVWQQMEALVALGLTRRIGVSNFKINQLEALLPCCEIPPFVNQIEMHPGFSQAPLRGFCQQHGIRVQAWSPLRSGRALKKAEIRSLAERCGKSPAQLCLKWCQQNHVTPIVKSTNPERMRENLDLDFVLTASEMEELDTLPYLGSSGLDSETLTLFG